MRGRDDKTFRFAEGDGCDLSRYENNSFDIVHSNSVIEHLGGPGLRLAFAAEVRRLAPSYFVQTPNFWFPVEPHFMFPVIHWLPEGLRADLLARMPLGIYRRAESRGDALRAVRAICLLTRRQMAELFPDGRILTERLALLPKSLVAVRGPL